MKRSISLVLWLMSACTAGLLGFQLYWNYQAYRSATRTFRQDTSAALETAVQQELAQRRQGLVQQFQTWLADTSQVVIGCHVHPLYQTTSSRWPTKTPLPPKKASRSTSASMIFRKS